MPELLIEIGVEELPALSIEQAAGFMKEDLIDRFKKLYITHGPIETYGTPRRLVAIIRDLKTRQEDTEEEILGPSVQVALDDKGNFTKAALGFIAAKGIKEADVFTKALEKGEVIAAIRKAKGWETKDLLPTVIVEMMRSIPFKKKMRWEASNEAFARPVRWLLCLFDNAYVTVNFADVTSSNTSRGHRFMSKEPFVVTSVDQYHEELAQRYVMLSSHEREKAFIKSAQEKLALLDTEFQVDQDLMATVRNLFEYPFAVVGSFERKYLEIPHEILICEMKAHQKCFAVYDRNGNLLPNFVCSAATLPFDENVFAKGNARVLRARFEDGDFYFATDREKTLRQHAEKLSTLIFERELGTVKDKSDRILSVALKLAQRFDLPLKEKELLYLACPLLKADLVTGVVGQFPELQGVMGRIYATRDGEDPLVCEVIETHYWPRFAEDDLPKSKVAALVSLADKLDSLVGIIGIGKVPKGNKDPFALRRSAIGIVRMLIQFGFHIDLADLVHLSMIGFGSEITHEKNTEKEAVEFIIQRARQILIDELSQESREKASNFADGTLAKSASDLLDVFARAHALHAMYLANQEEFDSVVQAFKRASNIVKKAEQSGQKYKLELQDIQYLVLPSEIELLRSIEHAKSLSDLENHQSNFESLRSIYMDVFSQIAMLKPKLDAFFDQVMVMVDDKNIRNARLALLSEIKNIADRIADFTHL